MKAYCVSKKKKLKRFMKDLLSKDLSSFVLINSACCKIYYHKYIFGVLHNFV